MGPWVCEHFRLFHHNPLSHERIFVFDCLFVLLLDQLYKSSYMYHCESQSTSPIAYGDEKLAGITPPPGLLVSVFILTRSRIPWCFSDRFGLLDLPRFNLLHRCICLQRALEGMFHMFCKPLSQGKPCYNIGEYKTGPGFTSFLSVSNYYRFCPCVCCMLEPSRAYQGPWS